MGQKDESSEKMVITGRQPCMEALSSGWPVLKIVVKKGIDRSYVKDLCNKAARRQVEVSFLEPSAFDSRFGSRAQGVAAVAEKIEPKGLEEVFNSIPSKENVFFVALDGIEDPHNLGAICRTAYAMGVHALVIPRRRTAALAEGAAKSSAGAIFRQPICQVPNIDSFIRWGKENGLWIYGLEASGEKCLWDLNLKGPIGLIVGSEGKGLSRLVKERCDFLVRIPMVGNLGSLNASVAAGMAIYEIARQRSSSY